MIAQTKWKKVISWICMLMILFCLPAFSDAQEITNAEKRNQMIRVYLSRLGLTDRLDVTVTVPYQLELENGGEIYFNTTVTDFSTIDGKVKLNIKQGTQNNTKVRLKGKGFPIFKKENEKGDLIVGFRLSDIFLLLW